jgi:DGQHR domain-containing protein
MNDYQGFLVTQQPNSQVRFLVFVARAKEIVRWARADSIRLDRGNVQRDLVEARWKQIKKFFNATPNNISPTSVTIAFDESLPSITRGQVDAGKVGYSIEGGESGLTRVRFPDAVVDSTYIIDGQHRLRGMSELDFDTVVPVCLLLSVSKLERAFQFITINNKSHKVPTDNLKALIANFESIQADLRSRLTQASVIVPRYATFVDVLNEDPESPFFKMVDWVNNRFEDGKLIIPPTALENSLKAISRAFPETKDDQSDALAVLYAIWRAIFAAYGLSHANAEQFPNLVLKATIQTLSEMVVEKLKSDFDPAFSDQPIMTDDGREAGRKAADLIRGIPREFWTDRWSLKSLDTSAGREIIEDDIRTLKRSLRGVEADEVDWKGRLMLYRAMDDVVTDE